MYNGNRVKDLLKERGKSAKELLDFLGVKENGTIARFVGTDIKASRLEQIADFFGVSVDYFFDRIEGDFNVSTDGALATRGGHAVYNAGRGASKIASLRQEVKGKDDLIADKERIIADKDASIADKERIITDKERIITEMEHRIALLEKLIKVYEPNP